MVGHILGVEALGMGHLYAPGAAPGDVHPVIADADAGDEAELGQALQELRLEHHLAGVRDGLHLRAIRVLQVPPADDAIALLLQRRLHRLQHHVGEEDDGGFGHEKALQVASRL